MRRANNGPRPGSARWYSLLEQQREHYTAENGIVKQKTEQMEAMKAHLEERLKTFDRWSKDLDEMEKKAALARS